ncbi:hypothetical protein P186_0117 [Pyrobaculum ferrireducens]|uniref:Uncharacterized protein n=1 Tax=Pyrobaculum ferrireducens TaxID=1104324 RepID=G7VEG1_9CREN|nr:hypothetical protein P186_0117 [Pyrobaculum ferrireducens]
MEASIPALRLGLLALFRRLSGVADKLNLSKPRLVSRLGRQSHYHIK